MVEVRKEEDLLLMASIKFFEAYNEYGIVEILKAYLNTGATYNHRWSFNNVFAVCGRPAGPRSNRRLKHMMLFVPFALHSISSTLS